jgi:hypothetical protein
VVLRCWRQLPGLPPGRLTLRANSTALFTASSRRSGAINKWPRRSITGGRVGEFGRRYDPDSPPVITLSHGSTCGGWITHLGAEWQE